ncbi:MAG: tyrosine--tRNA ligase [Parachlamydiales bacterium]|nr:tyrosine--tRNA ligase [Parachlamydiales bacterium]
MKENIVAHLSERGFVDQISKEGFEKIVQHPIKCYVGFDPTADCLHLGNFLGILALMWFSKFGHQPYVLIGGATGRIGDPSGKSVERPFLSDEDITRNSAAIQKVIETIFTHARLPQPPIILNNYHWLKDIAFIDFLRDIGKHFRLGSMLSKESVKLRLASEDGMSFTEFSYQILQAYDFYYLHQKYGITLQMGGNDQWGNITAGIDLTKRLLHQEVYGLTFPLLTRSDGKKFGKSEGGAIWLSNDKLSYYQFYQQLFRVPDGDVIRMLELLTFLDKEEIEGIEKMMVSPSYIPNAAQKRLAEEVTRIVHGDEGLEVAIKVTEGARPGAESCLERDVLEKIMKDFPHFCLPYDEVIGKKYVDLAAEVQLTSSKSETVRLIKNNGAYLNNEKITDPQYLVSSSALIDGEYLLLGSGKKKKILVKIQKKK